MTLPNQIGLEGNITPPDFMAQVESHEEDSHFDWFRNVHLNWSWLRVERHFGFHFDEPETVIELRLPWKVRYAQGGPWKIDISRSYVLAFGRVHTRLVKGSWHVRGGPSTWETPWL